MRHRTRLRPPLAFPRRLEEELEQEMEEEISQPGLPVFTKAVNGYVFDFVNTYLYAIKSGRLNNPELRILFLHALASHAYPVIVQPSISFGTADGFYRISNDIIQTKIRYMNSNYSVTLHRFITNRARVNHSIVISGDSPHSKQTKELYELLVTEAIAHSMYAGKILRVLETYPEDDEDATKIDVEIANLEEDTLNQIFLPNEAQEELRQFIYCVNNHKRIGTSLRYLISGIPGTGKTKIIRAIINACKGKATTLLTSGGDARVNLVFAFANIFKPCLVCIDDIDLIVGDRQNPVNKNTLGTFLQKLNGFVKNNVFVLATTNDKKLVDIAASRPGRFDMIIDVGELNPSNYLDLVRQQTHDPELIELFDNGILYSFKAKKITGAFLVNLVKQLSVQKRVKGSTLTKSDVTNMINRMYRGFSQNISKDNIGFSREIYQTEMENNRIRVH